MRCRNCGLPARIAETLAWKAEGTVFARRLQSVRMAMIDMDTLRGSCEAFGANDGREKLYQAEKRAVRMLAAAQLSGLKEKISRYGVVKKRILEAMQEYSLFLGIGRIEMERFVPGQGGSWVVKAACEETLVDAGIAGILEVLDGCGYERLHVKMGEGTYRLELQSAKEGQNVRAPEKGRSFEPDAGKGGDGGERCGECGLPLALGIFEWDEIYGTMETAQGGLRAAIIPSAMIGVVSWEAGEGGKGGLPHPLREAARRAALERMESGKGDSYEGDIVGSGLAGREGATAYLQEKLWMRGWGMVREFGLEGDGWRLRVSDPVDRFLVAGWLEAVFMAVKGRDAALSWEDAGGEVLYRLQ